MNLDLMNQVQVELFNHMTSLNMLLAAGGNATKSWISSIMQWVLGIVLVAVGFFLVGRALLDLKAALGKDQKEWGQAGLGFVVGAIGGFLAYTGVGTIAGMFKKFGNDIPKS